MPQTFQEWASLIQILTFVVAAATTLIGIRFYVMNLVATLARLTTAVDDLRRDLVGLDRRISRLEGVQDRRSWPTDPDS